MFLLLILAVGIFFGWLAYRKAKQNGHNPIRWTIIAVVVFLLTDFFVGFSIGFVLALGKNFLGWSETLLYSYSLHIEIASLLASVFITWLFVLRFIKKVPVECFDEPPAPPTFESSEK